MNDLWAFGWTQLLTIIGFGITIAIALGGFRSFRRWAHEKLEEKRIDVAIDALALAYESKFIFDGIRSELAYSSEYADMPDHPSVQFTREQRGSSYAALKGLKPAKTSLTVPGKYR